MVHKAHGPHGLSEFNIDLQIKPYRRAGSWTAGEIGILLIYIYALFFPVRTFLRLAQINIDRSDLQCTVFPWDASAQCTRDELIRPTPRAFP